MSEFYELSATEGNPGAPPVKLTEMKKALRLPEGDHPDDDFVTLLLKASIDDIEAYTGRQFRVTSWVLLRDDFADRMCLRRDPVDAITEVAYLLSGSWETISSAVYYLKKGQQGSEVLLSVDQTWPTDLDEIEAGVRVTFTTSVHHDVDIVRAAMRRHVSFMYENRGDSDPANSRDALKASGAESQLQRVRIARV